MILNDLCSLSGMTAAMQHFHAALLLKCRLSRQVCTLAANLPWFVLLLADLFLSFLSVVWLSAYFQHQQMLLKGEAGLPRSICRRCLPKWFSGDVSVTSVSMKAGWWLAAQSPARKSPWLLLIQSLSSDTSSFGGLQGVRPPPGRAIEFTWDTDAITLCQSTMRSRRMLARENPV